MVPSYGKVRASDSVDAPPYDEATVAGIPARSPVVWALVASLLTYAVIAATRHWWLSTMAAPFVALLLLWGHPRARFAAYIFFTVLALRGALVGVWPLTVYALVALGLMQTAAARRAWPRLVRGRLRGGDDRMRRS
jgi:hypothetical protein